MSETGEEKRQWYMYIKHVKRTENLHGLRLAAEISKPGPSAQCAEIRGPHCGTMQGHHVADNTNQSLAQNDAMLLLL